MNYYKYREASGLLTEELSDSFWNSYRMYIKRIAESGWFTEKFGLYDYDSGWNYSYNVEVINNRITEELGIIEDFFSLDVKCNSSNEDKLSLIEFFYLHMSKPTASVYGYNNEVFNSEFDSQLARYEYTVYVNNLLKNRRHCYKLKSGIISKITSEKLNKMYIPELGKAVDEELNKMIDNSFRYFADVKENSIDSALMIISNALERAKTLEGNKKVSVEKIISNINDDDMLQDDISELIKMTTKISNNYMIRHYEVDKMKISNKKFKEFLYYNYLNSIRLILSTYDIEI